MQSHTHNMQGEKKKKKREDASCYGILTPDSPESRVRQQLEGKKKSKKKATVASALLFYSSAARKKERTTHSGNRCNKTNGQ